MLWSRLGVDVVVRDGEAMPERRDEQAADDRDRQQRIGAQPVEAAEHRRQRLVAEHGVDEDRQRPRREQRREGGRGDQCQRQAREPAVRTEVGEDPRKVAEERPCAAPLHRAPSARSAPAIAIPHSATAATSSTTAAVTRIAAATHAGVVRGRGPGRAEHRDRRRQRARDPRPEAVTRELAPPAVLLDDGAQARGAHHAPGDLEVPAVARAAAAHALAAGLQRGRGGRRRGPRAHASAPTTGRPAAASGARSGARAGAARERDRGWPGRPSGPPAERRAARR